GPLARLPGRACLARGQPAHLGKSKRSRHMAPWPGKASAAPAIPLAGSPQALRDFLRDPIGCMRAVYQTHGKMAALVRGANDFIFAFGPEFNKELLANPDLFHATGFLFPGPRKSPQRRLTPGLFSM